MGKPFAERLATGLQTDRQNCETLTALIAETEAERERQLAIQRHAEADSVDVTLNESDRDEAAMTASKAKRLAQGYADALEKLAGKLEAKQSSERRQAEQVEKEAAEAERDEIAARFCEQVPQAVEILTRLSAEVEANERRLRAAGSYIRDAEAEARDVAGNYTLRGTPIDRFTKMKIPAWGGPGRQWPVDKNSAVLASVMDASDRQRAADWQRTKSPEAIAAAQAARAREEARWSRYTVGHSRNALIGGIEHRRGTSCLDCGVQVELEMTAAQAAAAREKGLTVSPLSVAAEAAA